MAKCIPPADSILTLFPLQGASAGAGTGFAGASGFASSFKGASASGILGKAKATLARAAATAVDAVKAEVRLAMMDEAGAHTA